MNLCKLTTLTKEFPASINRFNSIIKIMNETELTEFIFFAVKTNITLLRILIANNVNLDVKNADGKSPLHEALHLHGKHLEYLLVKNTKEFVRLHEQDSIESNSDYCVIANLLIDHGVDINAQDRSGESVLHYAIECEAPNIAKRLIEQGANVNTQMFGDNTPLMSACHKKMDDIAILLIEHGAILNNSNGYGNGNKILKLATDGKMPKLIQLLNQRGFKLKK